MLTARTSLDLLTRVYVAGVLAWVQAVETLWTLQHVQRIGGTRPLQAVFMRTETLWGKNQYYKTLSWKDLISPASRPLYTCSAYVLPESLPPPLYQANFIYVAELSLNLISLGSLC